VGTSSLTADRLHPARAGQPNLRLRPTEGDFMTQGLRRSAGLLAALVITSGVAANAQTPAALRLPVTGMFRGGGTFTGTASINGFVQDGNEIVAVGFVSGTLSRGAHSLGTAVVGQVRWPVRVRSGGLGFAADRSMGPATPVRIAWHGHQPAPRFLLVQAENCPVLNVSLGAITVDLLGAQVALSPVTLDLTGVSGTPLGDLVCSVSDLLGNVAAVVNLLNSILGLLTGLLGGLTGGIGGLPV
jgi:hypothetical protein